MIDHYDWRGGREAMLRFGPVAGPVVILLLPLFDEHNRTRTFGVTIARALTEVGIATVLPDLPGQGESDVPTEHATLEAWQQALQAIVAAQGAVRRPHLAVMRGAAVLDSVWGVSSVWRFAPIPGRAVLNDLRRAEAVSGRKDWSGFGLESPPANLVGNELGWPLYAALDAHTALEPRNVPLRTVRLESDPAVADRKVPGPPLWRRAEPGNDATLARLLAQDLAEWVRQCAG